VIVVDSSVWISHFANVLHPEVLTLRAIEKPSTILMSDLILVEVLRGARSEENATYIASELSLFDRASMSNEAIAWRAAANYRRLRAVGFTVRSTIDLLIGTYCIEHGHELLHRDRDFEPMERHLGLRTY
jgi:predicted nucleic acid-binding protein